MRESYAIRVYKQYFNFGSAHFLIFSDGTREPLHGHNYQAQVKVEGNLDEGDVVIDFIPFKPLVKALCDALDHCTLLPRNNPYLEIIEHEDSIEARHRDGGRFVFPLEDVKVLPIPNTSTEMLARYLAHGIIEALPARVPQAEIHAIEVQVEESGGQCGICRIEL
ncbi:MAG: 6-carboxytetrahydropterin synthase [Myxococcota bacterium]|nr:6-carboxytetrahydropterin synthase [Myxococcota bacterium]